VNPRHHLASAVVLAVILGAAAGYADLHGESVQPAALLVIVGGCLVGGILPERWWLAILVGVGVPLTRLLAPEAALEDVLAPSGAGALLAPLVALAAGGLGAAMVRHLRS
jgi:hypothetical protein